MSFLKEHFLSFLKEHFLSTLRRPFGPARHLLLQACRDEAGVRAGAPKSPRPSSETGGRSRTGRRPARRGSLEGPVSVVETMVVEARQGFVEAAPPVFDGRKGRCGSCSRTSRCWWAAQARVPVIFPPRRGGMERFGRSQAGSINCSTTQMGS